MRLIDADLLIEKAKQDGAYDYVSAEEIANAPTIDICKDCDCRRVAIEALSADTVSREQYDYVCEEYNRLVHKAVCIKLCDENCEYEKGKTCYHAREHSAIEALEQEPVDAVPVVRCKDCRWWEDMYGNGVKGYCHACKHGYHSPTWEIGIRRTTDPDFYCGDGERREP